MIAFGVYNLLFAVPAVWAMFRDSVGWFITIVVAWGFIAIGNAPKEEEFLRYQIVEIESTAGSYNNITGNFTLGTGYIRSKEMYSGNVYDGGFYERVYVPVVDTKRKVVGYLTDKAIYKRPICKNKNTLFRFTDEFECAMQKGILEVPRGTIVEQLNFQ